MESLARAAPDLNCLRNLAKSGIRGVPVKALTRMQEALRLSELPGVPLRLARRLVESGLGVEVLGKDRSRAAKAAREFNLSPLTLAAAGKAAGRAIQPREPEAFEKAPPRPFPMRSLVVSREMTWQELAEQNYALRQEDRAKIIRLLAAANGSPPERPVEAGARLGLPGFPNASFRTKDEQPLTRFAAYLERDEAERLSAAGFTELASLAHLDPERDARITGVPATTLSKLRVQAVASSAGLPAPVAHALAFSGYWDNPAELAVADPRLVGEMLEQAAGKGLLETGQFDVSTIWDWLADIGSVLDPGSIGGIIIIPEDSPCDDDLPPDASIENFYNYRTVPAGRDAITLSVTLDQLWLYLEEAASMRRTGGFSSADAEEYRGQVLASLGVTKEQQKWWQTRWGFDTSSDSTADQKLSNLQRFLSEQADLTELVKDLTEGHQSFQRGELGLALAAYGRVDSWFTRMLSTDLKKSFDLTANNLPSRVKTYYETTRPTLDDRSLLDNLQESFDQYHAYMLTPWDPDKMASGPENETFRKHLLYIRNFVLPLCLHDCYLELGNYCEAMSRVLEVHIETVYTDKLDTGKETVLGLGMVATMPAIDDMGLDPTGWGQFPDAYLHPVEGRLLNLKVSNLLRAWGEYHERRANSQDPNDADLRAAKARYAQVLRVHYDAWTAMKDEPFSDTRAFRKALESRLTEPINPLALENAMVAHLGAYRMLNGLNFIGYDPNYVPVWTYHFLLESSRYYAEHARQLERDALQFLASAEQELGNQRLLTQQIGTATSQLAVENRRVAEAEATVEVAEAGQDLASTRTFNNQERLAEWDNAAPTLMVLGVMGGAIGGASSGGSLGGGNPYAMGAGAVVGGVSSYVSGSIEQQMHRNEMLRSQRELDQAITLAAAEVARAQIGVEIARLTLFQAATTLAYAQSNLEFATAKTLSADFWFTTARRAREFAQRYLDSAIRIAYLAEQAFEFLVGRRVDRIKFDYASTEQRLAADALLLDIDSVEAERILSRQQKDRPIRHVINLRTRDFWAFEQLKRTGSLTFDTTVAEFDLAYPGTFMRRLVDIEVEVQALTTPSGVRGVLTKSGLSWLRFKDSDGLAVGAYNVAGDWITHTPSEYKIAPVIQQDESMILSTFNIREDSALLSVRGQQDLLKLFEGSGLGCTWRLELESCANDFDLSTITDVNLILYTNAFYDPPLADAVKLERQKLIALGQFITEKSKGYSFAESLPDPFYHLLNPSTDPDSRLERSVSFDVLPSDFPTGEVNRKVEAVLLAFPNGQALQPMRFHISSAAHSPGYDLAVNNTAALVFADSTTAVTDPSAPNVYAFTNFAQDPVDRWFLRLRAEDNPALATTDAAGRLLFDDTKLATALQDVWWLFRYRYELAGDCGNPAALWGHFAAYGQQARCANPDGTVSTAAWTASGSGWGFSSGAWQKSGTGGGRLVDSSPYTWDELCLTADLTLPGTDGAEVGLLVRHQNTSRYQLRLVSRTGTGKVDAVLERVSGGSTTELGRRDGLGLLPGSSQTVALECRGARLQARIGGVTVMTVSDPSPNPLGAGHVGFYGSGSGGICSDLVLYNLKGRP